MLQRALALHHAGAIDEAATLYQAILRVDARHFDALHLWGVLEAQRGRFAHAEQLIGAALEVDPRSAPAWSNRGNVQWELRRFTEALASYDAALRLAPEDAQTLSNRGNALAYLERFEAARAGYETAIALRPDLVEAWANRGNVLLVLKRPAEALASFDRALVLRSDHGPALNARGNVLLELGRPAAALVAYAKALGLRPDDEQILHNRGNALRALDRSGAALIAYDRALAIAPQSPEALMHRGLAVLDRDGAEPALADYARALAVRPDFGEAMTKRASALRRLRRHSEALILYDRVLALRGDQAEAHYNRGRALQDLHRPDEALQAYRRALALSPGLAEALNNTVNVLLSIGLGAAGRRVGERAVAAAPFLAGAERNLLSAQLYTEHTRSPRFFERAIAFARRHRPLEPLPPLATDRDPDRPLRIGFVSSDLHAHPVGKTLQPAFEHRERGRLTYVCYAHERREDETARWFRASADVWRSIAPLPDREVAELIRRDRIDVLAILAGYFDMNRPLVAAYRAAPVQVSLYDGATSGIAEMDYIVGDPILIPDGGPERFVETVVRLPTLQIHSPHAMVPVVTRPDGRVAFGSFNNPAKLTPTLLALWARVLGRLPESRLILKYKDLFAREAVRRPILDELARGGVGAGRVTFLAADEGEEAHLARYGEIDVALDCFPFTGATTTFEALWMGVPVVTLCGGGMLGRMSAAHLIPLGLGDLVATTPEDYVGIAVRLAEDHGRRRTLRATLRARLLASSLMDGRAYARSLEALFRDLWRRSVGAAAS